MCISVHNGISYSHVCGRVVRYQYGTPDASLTPPSFDRNRLDSHYIDGISITMGPPPRKHVWSLMAGHSEKLNTNTNCPCNAGSQASVQSIIGNNYFCESGNPNSTAPTILYSSDPLYRMVKTVVLLKLLAARLLIFHGSTENLTLVLLTSLSYGYVAMHKVVVKMFLSVFTKYMCNNNQKLI